MWKLVPVVAISLALALFSDLFSRKDPMKNRYVYQEKFLWIFIIVTMALFAGLRTSYNDTFSYMNSYELTSCDINLANIDWNFGNNPGYSLVQNIFKHFGFTVNAYLLFYSIITYSIYIWFIHKYSSDFLMSIFLFICLVFTFPMAALKQCAAVAFCLVAVDKAMTRQLTKNGFGLYFGYLLQKHFMRIHLCILSFRYCFLFHGRISEQFIGC